MTIKSILFAVAAAALIGAAVASCPNACSGHGSCGNHDRCKCYATYIGGDCSERTCPYGANGNECSGRGTCDRGAGVCECADGYGGASCQRLKCPNDCSGSGSCDTTTGLCSCAGGYSGNDCSARLCPKGDDPLTNEVENSGDGSAMQTSEVQTVTFNAGRGLGGTATLTYHDLYGQAWTTRPFSVGGDNVYRLEISVKPTSTQGETGKRKITFSYNGLSADVLVLAHGTAFAYDASGIVEAEDIRAALTPLFATRGTRHVEDDRANSVHVYKHNSATSAKIGGAIEANARLTFDIVLPIDMSNHDDNGGLASAFTASWKATPDVNEQVVNLYSLGDRSGEIESALTSLPNNVIPSVTVAKVGVSDASTNSAGSWGNAYAQSYTISFNDAANSGDQNMLGCNAEPCDEDGCMNRGTGVSEVRYMHHDPESYGQGINFVSQGYFIMDIGSDTAARTARTLSQGSIKLMWDTGSGIESAIFSLVATAAEVQTALRTITGWESVTVALESVSDSSNPLTEFHQFRVTLPAGYDDMGKSPTFYTMKASDGAYADANPSSARATIFDQRFSNSIWLGKTTGWERCVTATNVCTFKYIDAAGTETTPVELMAENNDKWVFSARPYATGGNGVTGMPATTADSQAEFTNFQTAASKSSVKFTAADGAYHVYLKEAATSVQTSDYFAVGATVEVLPTTWKDGVEGTDVLTNVLSKNTYRKFKITGHVTNKFNREFAKLDSFPADDGVPKTDKTNILKPKYNVKITSNNGTVHQYADAGVTIHVNEVQILTIGDGKTQAKADTNIFKLSYKGEETKNMDGTSSAAQVAEEINSFSALSGPVSVAVANLFQYVITFDAKDGDVAQLVAHQQDATSITAYVSTQKNGWSIEGPPSLGLDTMQAGGTINITAAEECTFDFSAAYGNNDYFFCYHGVCSHHTFGKTNDHNMADFAAQSSIAHIRDDNGHALIDNTTLTVTTPTEEQVKVTLPSGMSCDPLEIRGSPTTGSTSVAITKTVDRHNNGKQFKITRSFEQSYKAGETAAGGDLTLGTNELTCADKEQTSTVGCHAALANVDAVVFSSGSSQCGAKVANDDADADIFYRTISGVTKAQSTGTAASTKLAYTTAVTATKDNCVFRVARHVITLDAMPTASAHGTTKTLNYVSPVGSCSVSETTKGSQESYECSNRGACDAKSGVCSCYEGYSGQSCQTQTVLV